MFKRVCSLVLATVLACGGFGAVASAKNNKDTPYSFYVTTSDQYAYTSARAKEDTSSTYVNLTKVPAAYVYVDVQGYMPSGSSGSMVWLDETYDGRQLMSTGKWLVHQGVYEGGGRSARLKFQRYMTDGSIGGYWSPDSKGTYPYINPFPSEQ